MNPTKTQIVTTQRKVYPLYWLIGKLFGLKVRRQSIEIPNGRLMLVSNHISLVDAFLIIAQFNKEEVHRILPIRTITANYYLYGKPFSFFLRKVGCFPAKPKKGTLHGLEAAKEYAEESSLFFFPEGERYGFERGRKIHTGAAVVATESGIPILPLYIHRKSTFRFEIVRGDIFSINEINIDLIMDRVWELKQVVAE